MMESERALALSQEAAPRHLAIIMDGNRRWARTRGFPIGQGHAAGLKALFRTVQEAAGLGVEVLTAYSFSTENWARTQAEVKDLLDQITRGLDDYTDLMLEEGVRLLTIGDLTPFPTHLQTRIQRTCALTAQCNRIKLVLALNYGGRAEICRAVNRLLASGEETVTEERLTAHLDTAGLPELDLVVRTSGEMRLSNFLLWQAGYAEIFVTDVLWPDFGKEELRQALASYAKRDRRGGQ